MFTTYEECMGYYKEKISNKIDQLEKKKTIIDKDIEKYKKLLTSIYNDIYTTGYDPSDKTSKVNVITKDGEIKS